MFEPDFDKKDDELTREEILYIEQTEGQCPDCRKGVLDKDSDKDNPKKCCCKKCEQCFEIEFSVWDGWGNIVAAQRIRPRKFVPEF